jgi:hypothetical protein
MELVIFYAMKYSARDSILSLEIAHLTRKNQGNDRIFRIIF